MSLQWNYHFLSLKVRLKLYRCLCELVTVARIKCLKDQKPANVKVHAKNKQTGKPGPNKNLLNKSKQQFSFRPGIQQSSGTEEESPLSRQKCQ